MMKPLELEYQKIDMCPKFCILYYLENVDLTKYGTCWHAWYKPGTGNEKTFVTHRKMRCFTITNKLEKLFISPKTTEYMT